MDQTYLQTSDGNGDAALMHVTNSRSIGATTIAVDTVSNVPNKFIATYGELLPSGFIDPSTAVNFYGHLSGSDLEIDGFLAGSTDAGNQVGDVVVIRPNTFWANFIATFLQNVSNDDASALAADVINTANIVDKAVTADKVDWGDITIAFRAHPDVNQSYGSGVTAKKDFKTEVYDYGDGYNESTSVYTAPVKGIYHFTSLIYQTGSGSPELEVRAVSNHPGDSLVRGQWLENLGPWNSIYFNADLLLDEGETVEIWVRSVGGVSSVAPDSYFMGHLVSRLP